MTDNEEGYGGTGNESTDSDGDGTADFVDPLTTHFASDTGSGTTVLSISDGVLDSCSTVDESASMSSEGMPKNIDFKWGFITFRITGLEPYSSTDITLIPPENLGSSAQYWKYDQGSYSQVANATVSSGHMTFTLTDDDGDGIVTDPGAIEVPTASGTGPAASASGGGCSFIPGSGSSRGVWPPIGFLFLAAAWLYLKRGKREK